MEPTVSIAVVAAPVTSSRSSKSIAASLTKVSRLAAPALLQSTKVAPIAANAIAPASIHVFIPGSVSLG